MATAVGVDVGGTKILGIAVEDTGRRVGVEVRRATPHGAPALLDAIVGVIAEVGASAGAVDAVGLGIPGLVDRTGRLAMGPNLPDVTDVGFRSELHARVNHPVAVDNDA